MGETSDTWQTRPGETTVVEIGRQRPSLSHRINANTRMHSTKYIILSTNKFYLLVCSSCPPRPPPPPELPVGVIPLIVDVKAVTVETSKRNRRPKT